MAWCVSKPEILNPKTKSWFTCVGTDPVGACMCGGTCVCEYVWVYTGMRVRVGVSVWVLVGTV